MVSVNKGKSFEHKIEASNLSYVNRGLALIQRITDPVSITGGGKIIRAKSTIDFLGVINGRSIAIEAKQYSSANLTFPLSNISDHQLEYLKMHSKCGGISIVAIHHISSDIVYLIPYKTLEPYLTTVKSLKKELLEEISILSNIEDYLGLNSKEDNEKIIKRITV